MAAGSEELEKIRKALPEETVQELSRLANGVPPEAFAAWMELVRVVPADALSQWARVAELTPKLPALELSVVRRAMRAITSSFDVFDQEELSKIASEETDAEVLLEIVAAPWFVETLEEKDPLAEARLRGVEEQRRLLSEAGGVIGATEVAKIVGISRQAVDARQKKNKLLAVSTGRHGRRYPLCQFDENSEDKVVRGLDLALAAIDDDEGWMRLAFLLSPEERLGGARPLDALRSGETEAVEEAARVYGEQVAY